MKIQNHIITASTGEIFYMGQDTLKFSNLKNRHPVCYPDGYIEKGDILIYLSCNQEKIKEVCETIKVELTMDFNEVHEILIISDLFNEDVSPIVKINFADKKDKWNGIQTIYERTEICAEKREDTARILADGICLERNFVESDELACILRSGEMIYFTPDDEEESTSFTTILKSGRFPSYIDESLIKGQNIKKIISPSVWNKISEMDSTCSKIYMNEFGQTILVEYEELNVGEKKYYFYSFYDKESVSEDLINKTKFYNSLIEKEREKATGEIHFNSFRLWGSTGKLMELERILQKASVTNSTILLEGESGTGKTFLAKEIHNCSKRAAKPFVHVNCAAIPYHLMESELFGYEEGAFTGARKGGKAGLFEMAYGGTLFLDEITEIPLSLQGKMLEVLQSKTFYRVGGTKKHTVDVRLITATNRNLKELVIEKSFREDLYYRINVFPIEIPPLRERMGAIQAIIGDILPDMCDQLEIEPVIVGSQALAKMKKYYWPGNIRELENVLEKAAILCDGKLIMPEDIVLPENNDFLLKPKTLKELKENCEKEAIKNALQMFHWDKIRAAQYLNIGRTNMFEKIKKYRLDEEKVGEYDFR